MKFGLIIQKIYEVLKMVFGIKTPKATVSNNTRVYSVSSSSQSNLKAERNANMEFIVPLDNRIINATFNNNVISFTYPACAIHKLILPPSITYGARVGGNYISNLAYVTSNKEYTNTKVTLNIKNTLYLFNTKTKCKISNCSVSNGILTFNITGTISIIEISTSTPSTSYGIRINGQNQLPYQPLTVNNINLTVNAGLIPSTDHSGRIEGMVWIDKLANQWFAYTLFSVIYALGAPNSIGIELSPTKVRTTSSFTPKSGAAVKPLKFRINSLIL
ncbi:hypothetical protein A1D23_06165 [Chelonobacter oris]|uniref:hypothetical protein n=1 Tax=Chelonobacter oris TaxID=505317 RepID=UPI002448BD4E|nr:hypothetical protein [Chelonobacter oris]MDH2999677.1 hypothetical protein [Chelonobacter oris]